MPLRRHLPILDFLAGSGKRHYGFVAVLFAVLCQLLNKLFLFLSKGGRAIMDQNVLLKMTGITKTFPGV